MKKEQIRQFLEEDVGVEEAADLLPLLSQLQQWQPHTPAPGETEALVSELQQLLPRLPWWRRWPARIVGWWPTQMLLAQARVVRSEIWSASTLVIVLGLLVSIILTREGALAVQPLVLLSPLVAAAGIAFLYSPANEQVRELELATAVSPRLLLLTRLLLVFTFNLLLGAGASMLLASMLPEISWWTLVTLWLAPMTFLSALAFLLTVLTNLPDLAMLVSLILWVLQIVRKADGFDLWLVWLPDLTAAAAQPWLLATALLLFGVALWAGGREERWL